MAAGMVVQVVVVALQLAHQIQLLVVMAIHHQHPPLKVLMVVLAISEIIPVRRETGMAAAVVVGVLVQLELMCRV
jgi:cell shape-determining protein MreD